MRSLTFTRILGTGAFGSVYLADLSGDRGFRRQVAVKVLLGSGPDAEIFVSRVRDEARLLGLLRDEHILEVIELVRLDGKDAVVMEYVNGVDLSELLEKGQRPPVRALAELGAAVAGALDRAHHARHPETEEPLNVVHRDVKPANVMLTERGGIKLLDFGVARARFAARESHTGQFVLGTLNYMAPEYVLTGEVDAMADSYGLGVTLWEAAAGETYGQPKLREEIHNRRRDERIERLPEAYAPLRDLLREMLTWRPGERPSCAAAERRLLEIAEASPAPGLRTWAAGSVPAILGARSPASKDEAGFLGRTVRIAPSDPTRPAVEETHERGTVWEESPPVSRPAHPAAPRRPAPPSILSLVLKGTLLGAALAILLVIFFGALFYGRLLLP